MSKKEEAKPENKLTVVSAKTHKPKNMFTELQEEMFATTIEALIPKIKPFIKPAVEKFVEFLGDNSKTIIIRRLKNGSPTVFIFDNEVGDYEIRNDSEKKENIFTASSDPSPVKDIYNIDLFIERLLSGELMKEMKNK